MNRRARCTRLLLPSLPLAAAVLVLAGCLGDGTSRTLRVGTSGDYPPFSQQTIPLESIAPGSAGVGEAASSSSPPVTTAESGYLGFDVEIARAFADDTGRTLRFVPFRWPELVDALAADRFDVAMSGVTVRPERSVAGRFSVPVARTGAMLILSARVRDALQPAAPADDAPLAGLDVPSLRVAVNAGGHLERVARRLFQRARLRAIPDNAAVPLELARGEVDAVVTDTLEAPRWLASLPGSVALGPLTADWKAYWLRASDADLAAELDAWLLAQESSGRLALWRAAWFGDVARAPTATPAAALLAACDERLALMPFVAGVKRARGLAVVDPAREMRVLEAAWTAVVAAARERGVDPPPRPAVEAFYRAQIDAAVAVQRRVLDEPPDPALARFDLQTQLRPALLRIGDRMAGLMVRFAAGEPHLSGSPDRDLASQTRAALARHRLPAERLRAIATALSALDSPR